MRVITIPIKSSSKEDRIKKYLEVIYKFHKLTDVEIAILVEFILHFQTIQAKYPTIDDTELINKLTFDSKIKKEISTKLGIKEGVFQNYLTILRKKGVIKDNKLNPSYIPDATPFDLTFRFM